MSKKINMKYKRKMSVTEDDEAALVTVVLRLPILHNRKETEEEEDDTFEDKLKKRIKMHDPYLDTVYAGIARELETKGFTEAGEMVEVLKSDITCGRTAKEQLLSVVTAFTADHVPLTQPWLDSKKQRTTSSSTTTTSSKAADAVPASTVAGSATVTATSVSATVSTAMNAQTGNNNYNNHIVDVGAYTTVANGLNAKGMKTLEAVDAAVKLLPVVTTGVYSDASKMVKSMFASHKYLQLPGVLLNLCESSNDEYNETLLVHVARFHSKPVYYDLYRLGDADVRSHSLFLLLAKKLLAIQRGLLSKIRDEVVDPFLVPLFQATLGAGSPWRKHLMPATPTEQSKKLIEFFAAAHIVMNCCTQKCFVGAFPAEKADSNDDDNDDDDDNNKRVDTADVKQPALHSFLNNDIISYGALDGCLYKLLDKGYGASGQACFDEELPAYNEAVANDFYNKRTYLIPVRDHFNKHCADLDVAKEKK